MSIQSPESGGHDPAVERAALILDAAERAAEYVRGSAQRRVAPGRDEVSLLDGFGPTLPETPVPPA